MKSRDTLFGLPDKALYLTDLMCFKADHEQKEKAGEGRPTHSDDGTIDEADTSSPSLNHITGRSKARVAMVAAAQSSYVVKGQYAPSRGAF